VAVDEVKEKVWYHTCNNRGKSGCANRALTDDGGCTLWYDEAALLDAVEQRLHMPIPAMDKDYNLPEVGTIAPF
jgi:ATP-dependent RNA helicase DDX1